MARLLLEGHRSRVLTCPCRVRLPVSLVARGSRSFTTIEKGFVLVHANSARAKADPVGTKAVSHVWNIEDAGPDSVRACKSEKSTILNRLPASETS